MTKIPPDPEEIDFPEYREQCWNCGGLGTTGHECGEDCCCCLNPIDNVVCDICNGEGLCKNG